MVLRTRDRLFFTGSLRDSEAMMSNLLKFYGPAFFFEHCRSVICYMLCSFVTRRPPPSSSSSSCLFILCSAETEKMRLVRSIRQLLLCFPQLCWKAQRLGFFPSHVMVNGDFNWNFWHCLHLALKWQTSDWLLVWPAGELIGV